MPALLQTIVGMGGVVPWMLAATVLAAAILTLNYVFYRREMRWLKRLEALATRTHAGPEEFYLAMHAEAAIPATCVAATRIHTVRKLALAGIPIDVGDLSDFAAAHEEPLWRHTIPNFIVSVLLIVGLGGTFLALREMLHNSPLNEVVGPAQPGQPSPLLDTEKVRLAIERIYSGFGGAFNTSITGIVATVLLLAIRVLGVTPARERFFARLDFFTQTELVPLFESRPASPESQLLAAARHLDTVIGRLGELGETLHQTAASSDHAVRNLTGYAAELARFADSLGACFGEDSPIQRVLERLTSLLDDANQQHHELCDRLDASLDAARRQGVQLGQTRLAFDEGNQRSERMQTRLFASLDQFQQTLSSVSRESDERLQQSARESQLQGARLAETNASLAAATERGEEWRSLVLAQMAGLREALDKSGRGRDDSPEGWKELPRPLLGRAAGVKQALDRIEQRLAGADQPRSPDQPTRALEDDPREAAVLGEVRAWLPEVRRDLRAATAHLEEIARRSRPWWRLLLIRLGTRSFYD